MKSKVLIILCFLCASIHPAVKAQFGRSLYKDAEVFVGTGTSNYFGDVGGQDSRITGVQAIFDHLDIDLWQTRMMFTSGLRVTPWKSFSLSGQFSPIFIAGNDLRSDRAARAYQFHTTILELSLQGEYYFANRLTGVAPYGFIGLGAMGFWRWADYKNKNIFDYGTSYIFGIGTRFPTKNRFTHALDMSFHFSSTDWLDELPPNGNKDILFLISYKLNFELYTKWYYDHRGLVR